MSTPGANDDTCPVLARMRAELGAAAVEAMLAARAAERAAIPPSADPRLRDLGAFWCAERPTARRRGAPRRGAA